MKIKGLRQSVLSVLIIISMVITSFSRDISIKAATGDVTLDIASGPITVAGMVYTQKNSAGTVTVATGTIPVGSELVLTGSQTSGYNITMSGSVHPTIRYKNVYTNTQIVGSGLTGALNLIIDGTNTFLLPIFSSGATTLTAINVSGENTAIVKSVFSVGGGNTTIITVKDMKYDGLGTGYGTIGNALGVRVYNFTQVNSPSFSLTNYTGIQTENSPSSDLIVKDSTFDIATVSSYTSLLVDNCIIKAGGVIAAGSNYSSYSWASTTIKDSYIVTGYLSLYTLMNTITNSYISCTSLTGVNGSIVSTANTLKLVGSTIEVNPLSVNANDIGLQSTGNRTFMTDSALIFKGVIGTYKKRIASGTNIIDPVDTSNNTLYLNKIKVPGVLSSKVSVSVDGRTAVNLWTDNAGYLFLYATAGNHHLDATDAGGQHYTMDFTGATSRETITATNVIGDMTAVGSPTIVSFPPHANTNIEYSFDKNIWYPTITDSNSQFSVVFPDDYPFVYIRYNSKIYSAPYTGGIVGTITEAVPRIISTSNTPTYLALGQNGTLFVYADPVYDSNALSYQWFKDESKINGATEPVLNISNVSITDAGNYTCQVSEINVGTTTSAPISVLIGGGAETGELKILSQSTDKTLIEGFSTELYVNAKPAKNADDLIYTWYKDGEELSAVSKSAITLDSVTLEDSGSYVCRVSENEDYVESAPIQVNVEKNPLEDDLSNLNTQVENLASQVGTLTGQLNSLKSEKEDLQNTINSLSNQITDYTNQISNLQSTVSDLEDKLQDADGDKEELNRQIQDLNSLINNLNQQIDTFEDQLNAAEDEKTILESKVTDLTNDIVNLNTQITLLNQKLSDSEDENANLIKQVEQLQNTIDGLETDVNNLQNDLNSLTDQNNQLHSQVESLTNQNIDLQTEIHRLEDLLSDANETIGDLINQVNYLTIQVNTLTEQLTNANDDKTTLQATITSLENQINSLNGQITDLNEQVEELQRQLDEQGSDEGTLNQVITNLNNQITNLNQTVASLQQQLTEVTDERNSLQNQVNEYITQVENLNNQLTDVTDKLSKSEEENTELKNQVATLQDTISGLKNDITDLKNEIIVLTDNNKDLQEKLNKADETITNLNTLYDLIKSELGISDNDEILPAIQHLKDALEQEINHNNSLQQQINTLDSELNTTKEANASLITKLTELVQLVGSEDVDGIKDKIIEMQTALSNSESRIQDLEKEKSDLVTQLKNAEDKNKSLQDQIEELLKLSDSNEADLKEHILKLSDELNQMKAENKELQNSVDDLSTKVSDLNSEKTDLEAEIARLESLLETANSTIDELRQKLADLAATKTILESDNTSLKAKIDELEKQIANGNNSGGNSGSSNNSDSNEINELKNQLDTALAELEKVKRELADTKKQLEEATGGNIDNGNDENTDGSIPETIVVVKADATKVDTIINETTTKPIKEDTITASEGWEIAPTLASGWSKEINLVELLGETNKPEVTDYTFYAREEEKPEKVYTMSVDVEKPVAIPTFNMDKLIYMGSDFKLNIANTTDGTKVTYKSSDNSIAKVSKSGIITPVKEGTAVINGTVTKDGIPYEFAVNVTVTDDEGKTLNLKDQTVQTSSDDPVLVIYKLVLEGKSTKLDITGYSSNAIISYMSADSDIATVSKSGVIKGVNKGTTTVTVILSQNDKIYTYIIKVRVSDGTDDADMWEYLTV